MLSPRRLRSRAFAVLGFFAATNAVPRPGLFMHHHAGGDHAHVHPWGEDAFGHDDGDDDDADHDHEHAVALDDRPGFEDPDGDHGIHVHSQAPFQHSTKREQPALGLMTLVAELFASPALSTGVEPAPTASARGPPSHDADPL
jgi:hypothetical protein